MRTYRVLVPAFLFLFGSSFVLSASFRNTGDEVPGLLPAVDHLRADSTSSAKEQREKFDPTRDAAKDIADAVVVASKEGKRVLLDVGGEWCSWCHKLDKFFADNKDASDFLHSNYVVVKVNYSKENKNEKVLSAYPAVKGYPHLFVLDGSGKLLRSQDTGELESGDHHDHDKVMSFLKAWAPRPRE